MLASWVLVLTLALAFSAVPLVPAFAQDDSAKDEEPVGWPLTRRDKREIEIEKKRMVLPQSSIATRRALDSWPAENESRNITTPPEIAPLERFTPELQPLRIEYVGTRFHLTIASAALLDQIAMRLIATGETIQIVAHSTGVTASGGGRSAPLSTHEAVKLSFKRAMLIRLYLLDEGVRASQIELRALPGAGDDGPTERVDIRVAGEKASRSIVTAREPEEKN